MHSNACRALLGVPAAQHSAVALKTQPTRPCSSHYCPPRSIRASPWPAPWEKSSLMPRGRALFPGPPPSCCSSRSCSPSPSRPRRRQQQESRRTEKNQLEIQRALQRRGVSRGSHDAHESLSANPQPVGLMFLRASMKISNAWCFYQ